MGKTFKDSKDHQKNSFDHSKRAFAPNNSRFLTPEDMKKSKDRQRQVGFQNNRSRGR